MLYSFPFPFNQIISWAGDVPYPYTYVTAIVLVTFDAQKVVGGFGVVAYGMSSEELDGPDGNLSSTWPQGHRARLPSHRRLEDCATACMVSDKTQGRRRFFLVRC